MEQTRLQAALERRRAAADRLDELEVEKAGVQRRLAEIQFEYERDIYEPDKLLDERSRATAKLRQLDKSILAARAELRAAEDEIELVRVA